jgi:hypothetical protein
MDGIASSRILWFAGVALLVIVGLIWLPGSFDLSEFKTLDLAPLLGLMLFLALIAERALEVLLTTWRAPKADAKDRAINMKREQIKNLKTQSPLDQNAIDNAETEMNKLVDDREKDRMKTRNIALGLGLLLGILISAAGFRALHELVANVPTEGTAQSYAFNFVDIILTGCLIAGGSDGIHKISELYTSVMNLNTKKAREANPSGGSVSP